MIKKENLYITLDFEKHFPTTNIKKNLFTDFFKRGLTILHREKKLKNLSSGSIHLVIVSDEEIAFLNKQYRQKDQPTDVLSFSYFEEQAFPGDNLIGEVVISLETAKRQAKEHNKTLQEELQFLFVHGFLHLFGYDHEEEAERKEMFDLQDEILKTKSWRKIIDVL